MNRVLQDIAVAGVVCVVIGIVSGGTWPYFVVGLVLALSLAVMLLLGSYGAQPMALDPRRYAAASAASLAIGYGMFRLMDSEASWWAVGFILVGTVSGTVPRRGHGAAPQE